MAVLINFKICDNAKECGGIAVCPTGALSWDEEKETIVIDNSKCISCGRCEKECPIGAFSVAKDEKEYAKMKKEIDDDPRTTKDLFVDRYGAAPISEFFQIEEGDVEEKIAKDCITLIEMYNLDEVACLLKSIPIKDLTKELPKDTLYYKMEESSKIKEEYDISECPVLLVFKKGKLLGKIEGYYTTEDSDEVVSKLDKIVNGND